MLYFELLSVTGYQLLVIRLATDNCLLVTDH
jgi:hypothetical protein